MSEVPAGWYPSPEVAGQLQYWDGEAWTNYRAVASDEPVAAEQPQATYAQDPAATAAQQASVPAAGAATGAAVGAVAAGAAGAGATAGSTQTIVASDAADQTPGKKKRFGLPRRGSAPAAAAADAAPAAQSQEDIDKALKRARLISFAGGIGLFILGFAIGRLL
jgi:hypothetical protein